VICKNWDLIQVRVRVVWSVWQDVVGDGSVQHAFAVLRHCKL
jgi:hypothetical protein